MLLLMPKHKTWHMTPYGVVAKKLGFSGGSKRAQMSKNKPFLRI